MSNHHADKHGTYSLAAVHAITPAIERDRENNIKTKKAVLHFSGGSQLATNTDYDKLVCLWTGQPLPEKKAPVVTEADEE